LLIVELALVRHAIAIMSRNADTAAASRAAVKPYSAK